jgi:hypothetical protein
MDPVFASVILGFFALIIALVAVAIAIAYRQNDIAQEAIKNSSELIKPVTNSSNTTNKQDEN